MLNGTPFPAAGPLTGIRVVEFTGIGSDFS
jgi:hypothetical protein